MKSKNKTGSKESHDISPLPYVTLNPQLTIIPVTAGRNGRLSGRTIQTTCGYGIDCGKNSSHWHSSSCV